jgi:WD40 repeat protein
MKALTVICSLILSSLVIAPPMLAQTPAGVRLESGIAKEDVDGDLKSAIDIYQKIATDASASRDVRSKALLRLAGCYEKLGRQATQVYEQVVRDFADQPAATQARNRLVALQLGASSAPATMTQRKIEIAGASSLAFIDGQRAMYRDAATGALVIGDVAGNNKRVLFKPKPGEDFGFVPSRDFSMALIVFGRQPGPAHRIAFIKADGTGYREITLTGVFLIGYPADWSWDNRYVLARSASPDGTSRLLRIAAADGSEQEVLRRNSTIFAASFSPDGRFIAYCDGAPATFVIPSQGGEPQLISGNAKLIDWTRDGRYLAVASAHSGAAALQLIPVKDGKPAGDPVFVRYGSFAMGSTTASGSLLYLSAPDAGALSREWIADLDPTGRPGDWKPLAPPNSIGQLVPNPNWSPDSSQIAWTVYREDTGQVGSVARVRNLATGKERDLYRSTGQLSCVWISRHPNNLFCAEVAGDGTATNILSVAVESARTEQLGAVRGRGYLMAGDPPNDDALYFNRESSGELIQWGIGTGKETLLAPTSSIASLMVVPSPDGAWLKRFDVNQRNIEVRPMAGGGWKPLLRLSAGGQSGFSPDGKWIFYHDKDAAGKDGLYRIATAGGTPERLGDFPEREVNGTLKISPDGRRIIALASGLNGLPDQWLLENFEPKQQAAK